MPDLKRVIRRNTFLLAATLAVNSAVVQLVAAVSSLTFVLVTGHRGLLGLGPAIFLTASGVTGAFAGRGMDRFGRRPVQARAGPRLTSYALRARTRECGAASSLR